MMPHTRAQLQLSGLPLSLYLGVTEEERASLQTLLLHFTLDYPSPPEGCITDRHQDTLCYQQLSQHLTQHLEHQTVQLIEAVAHRALCLLREQVPAPVTITVEVEKLTIGYIEGTARFRLVDAG